MVLVGWDSACGESLNGSLPLLTDNDLAPCFTHILSASLYLPLLVSSGACALALRRLLSRPAPANCPYGAVVRSRRAVAIGLLLVELSVLVCHLAFGGRRVSYVVCAEIAAAIATWSLLCVYLTATLRAQPRLLRGHAAVLTSYALRLLVVGVRLRSTFIARLPLATSPWLVDAAYFLSFAAAFLHVLFVSSLIPSAGDLHAVLFRQHGGAPQAEPINSSAERSDDGAADERTPLLAGQRTVTADAASAVAGVDLLQGSAGGPLSRLLFLWANPLVRFGFSRGLRSAADTFRLPDHLSTASVSSLYAANLRETAKLRLQLQPASIEASRPPSLLRAMHLSFGRKYYAVGMLKLFADALGFCGPLLLGGLVTFAEDGTAPASHGALYAAGLFASTLTGALLSAHFDYGVAVVGLRVRAALVSAVYARVLAASSACAERFSGGELVNFMSTDTDRAVNFCTSFHQFWAMPLQVGVSLYLLYLQLGIASMAGLAFSVLLVPINRWIAVKIGSLSASMMEKKDGRVKIMTELLHGIRSVKMLSWEAHFRRRVDELRSGELHSLRGLKYLDAVCVYLWAITPVVFSILTFTTYTLLGHQLTAAKVFTSLSLFNLLITPLNAFPWVINGLMEAWVSLKRLQAFVATVPALTDDGYADAGSQTPSRPPAQTPNSRRYGDRDDIIVLKKASFSWTDESNRTGENIKGGSSRGTGGAAPAVQLNDLNLRVPRGSLVGVIGTVGSGKSSLLAAIAGEMASLGGELTLSGAPAPVPDATDMPPPHHRCPRLPSLAIVPQSAWLQRGSVRSNVLFGKPFEQRRYDNVVQACALTDDFRILPDGDASPVGENGSMLSGGQRARVTLARAAYQDKDIYLLDDPLAAVDARVASHIFEHCILGVMAGKTRVLCTHHTNFLRCADLVVAMDGGCIVAAGPPAEILPRFSTGEKRLSTKSDGDDADSKDHKLMAAGASLSSEEGCGVLAVLKKSSSENGDEASGDVEEAKEEGAVRLSVYRAYASAMGMALSTCVLLSLLFMQGSKNANDWWLSYWVAHDTGGTANGSHTNNDSAATAWTTAQYLYVYGGLAGANTVFTLLRAFLFAYGGLRAAALIHSRLLDVVLQAPVAFFDATPTGRVVNRFSSDVCTVDDTLPFVANILLAQIFSVLGTLAVTCYGLPWFLLALVPLSAIYYRVQRYYRPSSRELKRIASATLSSLYGHLSESVEGRAVIRAFGERRRFELENSRYLDLNLRAQFSALAASQWLSMRLQALGVAMVTVVALLAVLEHSYGVVNPGLVGLAMSYALSVTGLLNGLVSWFTETEKQMVAVERTKQYIDGVAPERADGDTKVGRGWPAAGVVEFVDVELSYAEGLPPALAGVSLRVAPGERLGIVGRTGSGKSSLFNALFRMTELAGGRVLVDGIDVGRVPLATLRSRLAIIPQTPFLFSGSMRDNLDPGGQHDDVSLWSALDKCHLKPVVERLGGLDAELPERGRSLSVGQSQLLCLARALIVGSKVLCIDEGTANVDRETDKLVQTTIREEFSGSTVLAIAHRIETVLDYDRIVVLSRGRVVESGPAAGLLSDAASFLSAALREQVR